MEYSQTNSCQPIQGPGGFQKPAGVQQKSGQARDMDKREGQVQLFSPRAS